MPTFAQACAASAARFSLVGEAGAGENLAGAESRAQILAQRQLQRRHAGGSEQAAPAARKRLKRLKSAIWPSASSASTLSTTTKVALSGSPASAGSVPSASA